MNRDGISSACLWMNLSYALFKICVIILIVFFYNGHALYQHDNNQIKIKRIITQVG